MTNEDMEKSILINKISKAGDRYGNLLIECMNKYAVWNLEQLTIDQLKEFIKERRIEQ